MLDLATIGVNVSSSEWTVALLGSGVLLGAAGWGLIKWIASLPATPDPWDAQVTSDLAADDCPQICHRCLTPHDSLAHLCPHCGVAVGTYTNLMPPLNYLSMGCVFRAGTDQRYFRSAGFKAAYLFASLAVYGMFFPILLPLYWRKLLRKRIATRRTGEPPLDDSIDQDLPPNFPAN